MKASVRSFSGAVVLILALVPLAQARAAGGARSLSLLPCNELFRALMNNGMDFATATQEAAKCMDRTLGARPVENSAFIPDGSFGGKTPFSINVDYTTPAGGPGSTRRSGSIIEE